MTRLLRRAETKRGSAGTGGVIRQARSRVEREAPPDDEVMAVVEKSLAQPDFSLDSCGVVFITWVGQP